MENIHNGEVNIQKLESLNKVSINKENEMKVIKICINEDTYRKIKSFGILLGLEDKEPILLGTSITKLYDMSKEKIYQDFV
ncbi:hypothetical protein [Aliarcobacter lanthieri]|uniref:hypothetical protein n=1 Tax=Aliarcobacter TaxID=2321111 RepID=UPI0004794EC6|nr:hypothetical protein [Aliarcobacter lanthieri]QKF59292.1 hypothetical protein ALANTH_1183 [Aliarcobacter lanthieri]